MLPPIVLIVLFEGAPKRVFAETSECREYLADVVEEHGDLYQVWSADTEADEAIDITSGFARTWADAFDFGSGDDPDEFLAPFPGFVLAHDRDGLVHAYRSAQAARVSDTFELEKLRAR